MGTMRSPNYPAFGLSVSVGLARKLWDKEKGTAVPSEVAAKAIGYKSLNGAARSELAAMKRFGLLAEEKQGLKVSQLALRILHPASEDDRIQAAREAALKPELFKELKDTHLDASDDAIKSHLITKLSFSEIGAKKLIEAFKDTMSFARLSDKGSGPLGEPASREAINAGLHISAEAEGRLGTATKSLRSFTWPLSAKTTARLEIVGNEELNSGHIDALTQYLEVARKLLKLVKE
jgi:hypothetical protein